MKKTFSTALICSGLLVLLLVGTQIVEVTQALTPYSTYYPGDPYTTIYTYKEIPPQPMPMPDYPQFQFYLQQTIRP